MFPGLSGAIAAAVKIAQLAQAAFILVAALAVYGFVTMAKDGEHRRACSTLCQLRPNYAARNRLAPDFELPSLSGGNVRLSQYRGKTVILNFWTKTCRPCLEEMPSLAEMAEILKNRRDVVVVTVSTDETREDVKATLDSVLGRAAPFVTLIDPDSDVVLGKYGTKLFPETWFIDKNGVIRARFDGPRDWSSALTIDYATSVSDVLTCGVLFSKGRPSGPGSDLCQEFAG